MATLTADAFARAASIPHERADRWLPHVLEAASRFDLGPSLAMWIAQCGVESRGFSALEENLNYSAEALLRVWPSHFTPEQAQQYARHPERIANRAYAGRLGNGDEASGDGWHFRGRGLIQLTFRNNHAACGVGLGMDLVAHPEMLATDRVAALSAGWFWQSRGLGRINDVTAVTRKVNGGLNGLAERRVAFERASAVLSA